WAQSRSARGDCASPWARSFAPSTPTFRRISAVFRHRPGRDGNGRQVAQERQREKQSEGETIMVPFSNVTALVFVGEAAALPGSILGTAAHLPPLPAAIVPVLFAIAGFIGLVWSTSKRMAAVEVVAAVDGDRTAEAAA